MNEMSPAVAVAPDAVSTASWPVESLALRGPIAFGGPMPLLFAALSRAQRSIGVAHKKSNNPAFKTKYADLSQVWDAIQEALPPEGLCVIQMPTVEGKEVTLTTMLAHESGAWISCRTSAEAKDTGPQAIGSVITYLRRYSGAAMAQVVQADDDGNAGQRGSAPAPAGEDLTLPIVLNGTRYDLAARDGKTAIERWTERWGKTIDTQDTDQIRQTRRDNGAALAEVAARYPAEVRRVEKAIEDKIAAAVVAAPAKAA